MYLSHYMYHGLVTTFTYIVFFWYIYIYIYIYDDDDNDDDVCFFTFVLHVFVSFLSLYTCFFFYTTCLFFTLYALMNHVYVFQIRQVASVSCHDLFSCKVFQELIVVVRLMYFWLFVIVKEIVALYLWFCHGLLKGEIVRIIFYVIG